MVQLGATYRKPNNTFKSLRSDKKKVACRLALRHVLNYKNKIMNKLILLPLALLSKAILANEAPISNVYKRIERGCSLSGMNSKNNWSSISDKAEKVTVTHYTSGNIEYLLHYKDESRGNEAIIISNFSLQCRLAGTK